MSISQAPLNNQKQSLAERMRRFSRMAIAPHPAITDASDKKRIELHNVLTLILTFTLALDLSFRPNAGADSLAIIDFMLLISLCSFLLGKSKYPKFGISLFSFSFISTSYLSLFLGAANSYSTSVSTTVPIALIIASALTGRKTFAGLAIYATLAAFLAPFYSKIPMATGDVIRTGGVVMTISAILYGIGVFRSTLENTRLNEIRATNQQLQEIKAGLEERVRERTRELGVANQQVQERAARFQIISEVSQEISSNVDEQPKELLKRITQLISEKLGFYHVGIFLIDENREYAVLRAANSQGGQRMFERHHQLKVGGTGIVGYVSQGGRPRIALDTGSDAVFFNNPDLPKTRSEMALPLKYGAKVIGVLDAQSTLPSAFKDEDANLLSTLANQVAIVISNVLANERAEHGLSSQKINKRGERLKGRQMQSGYSYLPDGTISDAIPAGSPAMDKVIASGETVILTQPSKGNPSTLAVPVKFRDQVIGIIQIESAEANRKWTEDEVALVQSISDRAALALENARLFEETVRRADQEETIARVTTQIGASTDFNRILQTTIQELGQALGASRSFIQLATPAENEKIAGQNTPIN